MTPPEYQSKEKRKDKEKVKTLAHLVHLHIIVVIFGIYCVVTYPICPVAAAAAGRRA